MNEMNELKGAVESGLKILEKMPEVKEVEVFASSNHLTTLRICFASNVPSNALEEPKSTENFGLSVRVLFRDGKIGFGKEDSDLGKEAVLSAFEKAKRNRVLDNDFHSLPEPRGKVKLKNYHDKKIMQLDDGKAVDLGYECLQGALNNLTKKKFMENVNITGEIDFLGERMAVANSNGINSRDESTVAITTLTTIFELEKDISGMWFDSATSLGKFNPYSAGETSVEKAYALRNAKSIDSGKYAVVLGRLAVADLLYSRFSVELSAIDLNASPYAGRLDEQLSPEILNIYDDGLYPGAVGTKAVTGEGLPTGKTELVKEGRLVNFLSNDYYCKKYSKEKRFEPKNGFRFGGGGRNYYSAPGVSATNLVVESGDFKEEELNKEIKNGVYIGRIWYSYPVNGLASADFTSTVRGDSYIIKNGEIGAALVPNTLRINDNLDSCFRNLIALSREKKASLAWGEEAVVITPEIALKELKLERIAKGLY